MIMAWRRAARRVPNGTAAAVTHWLFAFLVIVEVIRSWRHAMFRDEFETYWIAVSSSSFADVLSNMKYTAHPPLLYVSEWLVTRLTSDPVAIQVMQFGLAISVWILIYTQSPFSRTEKILLLLSYFLFWEYFIISRNYVLIALIGFAFIALRERQPRPEFALWLLLGLLANTHMYSTIWSMVLAAMLAIEVVRRPSAPRYVSVAGAAVYLALLAFAIVMMEPPPRYNLSSSLVHFSFERLNDDSYTPVGAFVPFSPGEVLQAINLFAHWGPPVVPEFWGASPTPQVVALTHADTDHPVRLLLLFAAPVAACWFVTRNGLLVLEFFLVYLGIVLFENIWDFSGRATHHGVVFLAFVAAVWSARARQPSAVWSPWLFGGILAVNAFGGVLSLASELQPFSESYETATWIKQNKLADAFLIGSHDAQVSTVVGYLRRPIYYLECECFRPFGIWDDTRNGRLSAEEFASRLAKAVTLAGQRDPILIRSRPVTEEDLSSASPRLSATPLKSFTDAQTDEKFWIYRMTAQQAP
jgi:hypothetical protein